MPPDATADSICSPSHDGEKIVHLDTYNPTMISAAIARVSRKGHINDTIHNRECTALVLYQRGKRNIVITCGGIQIYRPTSIRHASVHVQRKNEMLLRRSIDHRIDKERTGGKIDDGRAADA